MATRTKLPLLRTVLNLSAQLTGVNAMEGGDMDSDPTVKVVAIGCIAILSIWNCFGTVILNQVHWESLPSDEFNKPHIGIMII